MSAWAVYTSLCNVGRLNKALARGALIGTQTEQDVNFLRKLLLAGELEDASG